VKGGQVAGRESPHALVSASGGKNDDGRHGPHQTASMKPPPAPRPRLGAGGGLGMSHVVVGIKIA
jgi:hypothetical protein